MRQTPSQALLREVTRFPGAASAGELISRTVRQKPERRERVQHPRHELAPRRIRKSYRSRGHPNTGRCRQTMYVTIFVISENACPQETDPGHDGLGLSSSDLGPSSSVLELKPNKSESLSVAARHRLHPPPSGAANSYLVHSCSAAIGLRLKTGQTEKGVTRVHDNQLSILQFGADVHAARVTCSTHLHDTAARTSARLCFKTARCKKS